MWSARSFQLRFRSSPPPAWKSDSNEGKTKKGGGLERKKNRMWLSSWDPVNSGRKESRYWKYWWRQIAAVDLLYSVLMTWFFRNIICSDYRDGESVSSLFSFGENSVPRIWANAEGRLELPNSVLSNSPKLKNLPRRRRFCFWIYCWTFPGSPLKKRKKNVAVVRHSYGSWDDLSLRHNCSVLTWFQNSSTSPHLPNPFLRTHLSTKRDGDNVPLGILALW